MKNEWRAVVKYKPKDFEKIITLHYVGIDKDQNSCKLMFPLEIRINFVKIVKNLWFSSVSSEDFKRIILIMILNDWLKNF